MLFDFLSSSILGLGSHVLPAKTKTSVLCMSLTCCQQVQYRQQKGIDGGTSRGSSAYYALDHSATW